MLCLKSEALVDDEEDNHNNTTTTTTTITTTRSSSTAFLFPPLNLGSSLNRYFRKNPRVSSRSFSSGDASSISSDLEEAKLHIDKSRQQQPGNKHLHRHQLEEEVKSLQRQLQEEADLRLALSNAVEPADLSLSNSTSQIPVKEVQELLDSITDLQVTVSKLEQESVALHFQLSQERNERRLAEYRLRHLHPSSGSSEFDSSLECLTEPIIRPCGEESEEEKTSDLNLSLDKFVEPNIDRFLKSLWNRPNQLSEEMVMCMRDIYLFLADSSKHASLECRDSPLSPEGSSFSESLITNPPTEHSSVDSATSNVDINHSTEGDSLNDPYRVPDKLDWTKSIGAYSMAVEVSWLSVGKKQLEYAAEALKKYRLLVEQLANMNPSCMSCDEKLSFWINLYNALIMHAYLAYGVPGSDIKLFSLMQKAAYTIGGHSVSAADIEYITLKMKPPAHRPQIALVVALQKFKVSEEQNKYSIDHPEPLLPFALSYGMHSSPAVRIFRPDNVNELLKKSLKDYVQASIGISQKGKLFVPKLLHCFAKGSVEDSVLPDWISQYLSTEQAAKVRDCSSAHKWRMLASRSFSVLPFDSRFRFLCIKGPVHIVGCKNLEPKFVGVHVVANNNTLMTENVEAFEVFLFMYITVSLLLYFPPPSMAYGYTFTSLFSKA
ncbi:hypothetical protein ACFE04_017583 [Oxalis oulophora]